MKRLLPTLFVFMLPAASMAAVRSVQLSWTDTQNPSGTTYTVKRGAGPCASSPTFAVVSAGITALTYTDTPVPPGKYCYVVTATLNGMESDPSNQAEAQVKPFPPAALLLTVQ